MCERGKETWLTCEQFAAAAELPERTARYAFQRAGRGQPVQRWPIQVRAVHGRGGRSGVRYEVALSSLPEAVQRAFSDASEPGTVPALLQAAPKQLPATSQGERIERRLAAIWPALEHPRGSAGRAAALRLAVRPGQSLRTLERWVSEYEAGDYSLASLGRRRPADAGQRRVHVSREFDRAYLAAGHDAERLPHWGERRDQLLKDWWASPAQRAGWKTVRLEMQTALWMELRAAGIDMPRKTVIVSQRAVMTAQHFREVDEHAHNRKVWDDKKSRIRRDNSLWRPMQEVVLDVKHLDVIVTRPDGSTVHPKMIAFMDSGTKRIFFRLIFPTKDERGVRQEHVISAFIDMVRDSEWGLPERIYMDNGSENERLKAVRPLLDLIGSSGLKTVVSAKPYSGASKPIESRFSELDRFVFSMMAGYVGGDRMKARRPELGKKTRPYPNSYEAFEAEIRARIDDFEDRPIGSGPFKGRSPREIFVDSGHRPTTIDPIALDAHFATFIERTVDRGAISINGTRYRRHDLPNNRRVTVALSYRRDAAPLVKVPGGDWAYLEAEQYHVPGMHDGALATARSQSSDRQRVRDMRKETARVDQHATMNARAADRVVQLPTAAAIAPLMDVYASDLAEEMGAAWQNGERAKKDRPDEKQRRLAHQMWMTEQLEAYLANGK